MDMTNGESLSDLDRLKIEVIKEQIIEVRIQRKNNMLLNKNTKFGFNLSVETLLLSLGFLMSAMILFGTLIDPPNTDITPVFVYAIASFFIVLGSLFFALMAVGAFLSMFFIPVKYEVDEDLCKEENKLCKELVEISLGGKVVSGKISNKWSEITVDKSTHMLKTMVRFADEDRIIIETRKLVVN